jgi:hypothetical protein
MGLMALNSGSRRVQAAAVLARRGGRRLLRPADHSVTASGWGECQHSTHRRHRSTALGVGGGGALDSRPIIIDGVLPAGLLQLAALEVAAAADRGAFRSSGQSDAIRSDHIMWLDATMARDAGMPATADAIQTFHTHITSTLLTSSEHTGLLLPRMFMLSCYDGADAQYMPHRDGRPPPTVQDAVALSTEMMRSLRRGSVSEGLRAIALTAERMHSQLNHRAWSAILYLNGSGSEEEWDVESSGGALRCFVGAAEDDTDGSTATEIIDVAPVGGRAVLFRSRELLHAVAPTKRRRLAMTAWIFEESILADAELAEQFVSMPAGSSPPRGV